MYCYWVHIVFGCTAHLRYLGSACDTSTVCSQNSIKYFKQRSWSCWAENMMQLLNHYVQGSVYMDVRLLSMESRMLWVVKVAISACPDANVLSQTGSDLKGHILSEGHFTTLNPHHPLIFLLGSHSTRRFNSFNWLSTRNINSPTVSMTPCHDLALSPHRKAPRHCTVSSVWSIACSVMRNITRTTHWGCANSDFWHQVEYESNSINTSFWANWYILKLRVTAQNRRPQEGRHVRTSAVWQRLCVQRLCVRVYLLVVICFALLPKESNSARANRTE